MLYHVSSNLQTTKPHAVTILNSSGENVFFLFLTLLLHILDLSAEDCEETNSRGSDRTGLAP